MSTFTDFKQGLQDFNDYISPTHHIDATLAGDPNFVAIKAEADFNLKDIICALLAGQGLQLPNLQICLSAAIGQLLTQPITGALKDALQSVKDALDAFLDHTNIDSVLGRLNGIIDEAAAIGSMINFCAAPVNPIAIPNMIQQAFGSFLGSGNSAINALGNILPENLCACVGLDGSFNASSLNAGALKDVFDNINDIVSGDFAQASIDNLITSLNSVATDLTALINLEGLINGNYSGGGSSLHQGECSSQFNIPRSIGIGMANPGTTSVALSLSSASGLRFTFSKLGGYPVIGQVPTMDTRGTKLQDETAGGMYTAQQIIDFKKAGLETRSFDSIFDLLVEPEMLALMKNSNNYETLLSTQQPVYDYCGNIIRYETIVQQGILNPKSSIPTSPEDPSVNNNAPGKTGNKRSSTTTSTGSGVQLSDLHAVAISGNYNDLKNKPSLGTAAAKNITDFATAAQGTKADSAVQPGANISIFTNDAGYLTTETDPVFNASAAKNVTAAKIINWDTSYGWGDHSVAGYQNAASLNTDIDSHLNQANPTSGFVLSWNGSDYAWVANSGGGGGINNIVEDQTPQLGGNLDANNFNIDMGTNIITDAKVAQWDTSYTWGDHSTAGYLSTTVDGGNAFGT